MKRDLEFLFEIGALRLIPRQWSRFHFTNVQNLAEHHLKSYMVSTDNCIS